MTYEPFKALDLRRELEWGVAVLERHEFKLVEFFEQGLNLQSELCSGNEANALQTVRAIESRFGCSAWIVQAKLALLQITEGQESQKNYASEIFAENTGLLRAIAHLGSQRNEGPVSIVGFKARANEVIGGWDVPGAWITYLKYVLLGEIPTSSEGVVDVLTTAATGNCVDLAASLVDLLAKNRGLFESSNAPAVNRIDKLLSRVSAKHMGALANVLTEARASVTSYSGNGAYVRTASCLSSILNRHPDASDRSDELEKLCLNFAFSPLFRVIARLAQNIVSAKPLKVSDLQADNVSRLRDQPVIWGPAMPAYQQSEELLAALERAWDAGNAESVLEICSDLDKGDSFDVVSSAKAKFLVELSSGDWQAAISTAILCIVKFPGVLYEFRFADMLLEKSWSELKGSRDPIALALAASYAVRELPAGRDSQRLQRHLQQLALLVLRSSRVKHFSELFVDELDPIRRQFLGDVCIEPVIEVNINLDSSKALTSERMRICQRLVQHDPANSARYLEEIRQLTYTMELEEGIRHFDSSRLFVNEAALQEWGAKSLAEDYARYKLLQGASLPDLADIQAAVLTLHSDRESPVPQALLEQPKTEADRLLLELVQRVLREFLYGSTSGLNSYLSLRVRHGSLAGHLRGPLEEAGAIALRDSSSGIYQPISAWTPVMAAMPIESAVIVNGAFDEFSQRFDRRVSYFVDELLQIKSENKPNGVFDVQVSTLLLNILKASIADIADPQGFVKDCTANFKASLVPAMERVRNYVREFKDEVGHDIDELLEQLAIDSLDGALRPVLDSIKRGRTNFNFAADRVSDWFSSLDRSDHERRYSIDQIIRIGEKLTTNTRPSFVPDLRICLSGDIPPFTPQFGAFLIADAMFIVFDNAYLHSKVEGSISIDVHVELFEDRMLIFEVENDVSEDAETESAALKLDAIRRQLESGEYRSMVSGEGGTGLFKLKRLTERSGGLDDVQFGFGEGRFKVRFAIPIMSIELQEEIA